MLAIHFLAATILFFFQTHALAISGLNCSWVNNLPDNAQSVLHLASLGAPRRAIPCVQTPRNFCDAHYNPQGCWYRVRDELRRRAENRSLATSTPNTSNTGTGTTVPPQSSSLDCTADSWKSLSIVERGRFIRDSYRRLITAHGLDPREYSPNIMMCKTFKESCFRPQEQNGSSSAAGLSQVTAATARDFFNRNRNFQSVVNGFTSITNGDDFHNTMNRSVLAQIELGLMIYRQKGRDYDWPPARTRLERYYGSNDQQANVSYANDIYSCAACVAKGRTRTSDGFESCLRASRLDCFPPSEQRRAATVAPTPTPTPAPTPAARAAPRPQVARPPAAARLAAPPQPPPARTPQRNQSPQRGR